jgi:uncharacterized repeat protein (TIGR04052 family)
VLDGKKLYNVRFDVRAGDAPFGCGKPAPLGLANTMVEPTDLRFYVHDLELVRANGERVPLALHQDLKWQRDNVALLDFADDQGKCVTGNPDIRSVVEGYAPPHDDYRSVAFKLGVPDDKNHNDGALAPAPYNATGMWWSWSGGYKYMRLDLTSAAQPVWYFHAGSTNCSGTTVTGFKCDALNIARIELDDYDPEKALVVFDVARFYAGSNLSVKDEKTTAGCMTSKDDPECAPLFSTLGVAVYQDSAPRPQQTAFVVKPGLPNVANDDSAAESVPPTKDPSIWPNPDFQRPPALDRTNISKAGERRSHPVGDPRHGESCMRCHQKNGPGVGIFTAAGTIFDELGNPATNTKVEIITGTPDRVNHTFTGVTSYGILDVDANGNFFTTDPTIPYDSQKLTARVLDASGKPIMNMFSMKQTGACNTCHIGGFRLQVKPPMPHL